MVARKRKTPAGGVLEELESQGGDLAEWLERNARPVIAVVAGSLLLAAAYGGYRSWSRGREAAAAGALSALEADFRTELGALPGSVELPELANPEAGRAVREEFVERFARVAEEHPGTTAGALARLEQAQLLLQEGDAERALELLRAGAAGLPASAGLRAIFRVHAAQIHERARRWAEAAQAYAEAGEIEGYALRYWALADAARCYAQAGDAERALALFDRIEREAPEQPLPDHLRELARELRAGGAG